MNRLRILTCCSVVLAALTFFCGCRTPATVAAGKGLLMPKAWLTNSAAPITPAEFHRPPDQTFLTYPEWFLVFGPAEQADFFQEHTATKFPYAMHVRQIWGGYGAVNRQLRGNFQVNGGYHTMIMVIATSSTAEFGLKSVYENVIGRLTDTRDGEPMTDEDRFNAKFAHDYVTFLDTEPWYKFNFASRLRKLWTQTSLVGKHPIRKWERKFFLTTELSVKIIYGWLIGLGTRTAYTPALPTTAVVMEHFPAGLEARLPDVKSLTNNADGSVLLTLPRYTAFCSNACELVNAGGTFKEIAGNRSAIMITVLTPKDWNAASENFRILFTQPIPTKPNLQRVALATPVSELHQTLRELAEHKLTIEHIFDF